MYPASNFFPQRSSFVLLLVTLATTLLLTAITVRYAQTNGKLAIPPVYDDSHSMIEGALRLDTWQKEGATAAWQEYLTRPPHSGLHYYFPALVFALVGISAPAIYWANGLFLLFALGGFVLLIAPAGNFRASCLLLLFASAPVCFNIVYEFRSECALAPLLFLAACCGIRANFSETRKWLWLASSGFFFALSFGMKPAMFPYTIGMIGAVTLLSLFFLFFPIVHPLSPQPVASIGTRAKKIALPLIVLWLTSLLPFSYHYWLNRNSVLGYITWNAFASDFWKQKGTLWEQVVFHLQGFPGMLHLGWMGTPMLFLAVATTLLSLFYKPFLTTWKPLLLSLAWLTFASFLGVAVNSMNQNYFGMTFHLLLIAWGCVSIAALSFLVPNRIVGGAICALALLWGASKWKYPITQDYVARTIETGEQPALEWRQNGPRLVLDAILSKISPQNKPKIWFACYGWVDANTVTWEALKQGLNWKMWNYYERPPADPATPPPWADVIVIPETIVTGTIPLPLLDTLPLLRKSLETSTEYTCVASVPDDLGRPLLLYFATRSQP